MMAGRLLACDLDRTLLPNGAAEESPGARALLAAFALERRLELAYVTGRRLELVLEAIHEYGLVRPHHVLADVGSSLYESSGSGWTPSRQWAEHLAEDWRGRHATELAPLFQDDPELELQEHAAQRPFKLSFIAPLGIDVEALRRRVGDRLAAEGLRSVVVHSVDEAAQRALVDVLPARSSKGNALEFLRARRGLAREEVLFAGDSGNDLEVLLGPIPSVLVANADADLRARVEREARQRGVAASLHVAGPGLLGMNGNYAAGILAGWVHFHPEDRAPLEALSRALRRVPE